MALFQIVILVLFMMPHGIAMAYFASSAGIVKNAYRMSQEQVVQLFFNLYGYGPFASSFYCYYATSKVFRKQVLDTIKQLVLNNWRRNQILPLTHTNPPPTIQQQIV
ncbi:unnamed protein product [Rotaria sp. Silwood2]|nr:unnamed protein product [Rotaria sp. Silwood2]CAF3300078.1 unnamed protein product [Rotaria sp. Silwood2]CAF4173747.1 unnamed protein product [Rotaria sp. Silwood2]CAF4174107.1 unnamed protein product [Rotaria sp. Silwood2]